MGWKKTKKKDYTRDPIDLSSIDVPMQIEHCDLDDWQQKIIDYEGNIAICSGRQIGKSAVMALKAAVTCMKYAGIKILITSGSERQAMYIYEKIKLIFSSLKEDVYACTPTMRLTKLKNGSEIYCLATGKTGDLIRGLSLDIWIPDEAAYIPEAVYAAISPMLWISKQKRKMGWIWALSTPAGKTGKFYELFSDPSFRTWRISSETCSRIPKSELESWKINYSKVQYAQEVLGEFVDEISRFFSDALIDSCLKKEVSHFAECAKYLGVDVARYGGDENAFVSVEEQDKKYKAFLLGTTERKGIHETFQKIIEIDIKNKFRRILVDDAGVGGGLTDFLLEKYQNKVVGINNSSRSVVFDKSKRKRLLKEDLYSNALILMEQGLIDIADDDYVRQSLSSILYEYSKTGDLRIYGRHSHITEAFVRALWGARSKGLNLWADFRKHV